VRACRGGSERQMLGNRIICGLRFVEGDLGASRSSPSGDHHHPKGPGTTCTTTTGTSNAAAAEREMGDCEATKVQSMASGCKRPAIMVTEIVRHLRGGDLKATLCEISLLASRPRAGNLRQTLDPLSAIPGFHTTTRGGTRGRGARGGEDAPRTTFTLYGSYALFL